MSMKGASFRASSAGRRYWVDTRTKRLNPGTIGIFETHRQTSCHKPSPPRRE